MAKSIRLDEAIKEFLEVSALTNAEGTVKGHKSCLLKLLKEVGNIYTKSLGAQHATMMLKVLVKTQQPSTIRTEFSRLRAFSAWLRQNQYLGANDEPFAMKTPQVPEKDKLQIPASEFGDLLDAASGPVERAAMALGLYLFLRQGEVRSLLIQDWDIEAHLMHVKVHKSKTVDVMPISEELHEELTNYMAWYRDVAPVDLLPTHHLITGRSAPQVIGRPGVFGAADFNRVIQPDRPCYRPEQYVQTAMRRLGYKTHNDDGSSLSEGFHTLRRSGARALYDYLIEEGYDGAGRTVQAMLHHKHFSTTEGYLQIGLDRKRRDDLIRGKSMYGRSKSAPVLRLVAGEGQS